MQLTTRATIAVREDTNHGKEGVNGRDMETGTYVWYLSYTDKQTGKWVYQRGTTVLIR